MKLNKNRILILEYKRKINEMYKYNKGFEV